MAQTHIITYDEFLVLSRPTSIHLDEDEVMVYVEEAEQLNIIPAITYARYAECLEYINGAEHDDADLNTLLDGGAWEGVTDGCGCNQNGLEQCKGLKSAVAYFAYAKMTKADGAIMARAGAVRHDDLYYRHEDDKIRQYDDVMDVAEAYLSSCLAFIRSKDCSVKKMRGTRCTIHAIGN